MDTLSDFVITIATFQASTNDTLFLPIPDNQLRKLVHMQCTALGLGHTSITINNIRYVRIWKLEKPCIINNVPYQITKDDIKFVKRYYPTLPITCSDPKYLNMTPEIQIVFDNAYLARIQFGSNANIKKHGYTIIDEVCESIKNTSSYHDFIEYKPPPDMILPILKDVHKSFVGKTWEWIISIDIITANFSCLRIFFPELVLNYTTWQEYISHFTNSQFLINSKHFRQVLFSNVSSKKFSSIEKYIISMLYVILKKDLVKEIYLNGNDEMCIVSSQLNITFLYHEICVCIAQLPSNMRDIFRITLTCERTIGCTSYIEKRFLPINYSINDIIEELPLTIAFISKDLRPQAYKYIMNQPVTENDKISEKNGRCLMFDTYYDFDNFPLQNTSYKSPIIDLLKNFHKVPIASYRSEMLTYFESCHKSTKYGMLINAVREMIDLLKSVENVKICCNTINNIIQKNITKHPSYASYLKCDTRYQHGILPEKITLYGNAINRPYFILIHITKPEFSCFRFHDPAMVGDYPTWNAMISAFTDQEFIIKSKYLRKFILGKICHKTIDQIELFLMSYFFEILPKSVKVIGRLNNGTMLVASTKETILVDHERILTYRNLLPDTMSDLWKVTSNCITQLGTSNVIQQHILYPVDQTKIKQVTFNKSRSTGSITNISADLYLPAMKYLNHMQLVEQDRWCMYNGQYATFLEDVVFD